MFVVLMLLFQWDCSTLRQANGVDGPSIQRQYMKGANQLERCKRMTQQSLNQYFLQKETIPKNG